MSQTFTTINTSTDTVPSGFTQVNDNCAALRSLHSGGTAPASTTPFMLWLDTSTTPDSLKMRNAADAAWVTILADVTAAGGGLLQLTGGTMTGNIAMSGTQKITGLAVGSSSADSATWGQVNTRILSAPVFIGTQSATNSVYIWVTQAVSSGITDVEILSETAVTADASHKWTFQVTDITGALNLLSAAKDTSAAAITADTVYALGVNQNNTTLAAGKAIKLTMTKTGSPNALTEALAVVKYTVATP